MARGLQAQHRGHSVVTNRAQREPMVYEKLSLLAAGALITLGITLGHAALAPAPARITQRDIDAAVARTLETRPLPSPATRAYRAVRASTVRVSTSAGTGTGVVVVSRGVILTSLHVVAGARSVQVRFENGLESEAAIIRTQPENDLAVLQAAQVPDELKAAKLGSARKLLDGEHVTAVGFPYGIGPSVSHGVISGLKREYAAPGGKQRLRDLIQFDAAANPGSSGGPLVNAAGEVIGIVTAVLSPGDKAGFSGIAFAVPIETAAGAAGLPSL